MSLKEDWLTDDELLARRESELAAANERIKELEKERDDLVFWKGHYERTENTKLTTEREISAKLEKALQFYVDESHEIDVGGGDFVYATCESREQATSTLAEVATLRGTEHAANPSHGKPQCIGYVTGGSKTITDAPQADHSQPVFIIPKDAMEG